MATTAIGAVKEHYLEICQEQQIEPHKFVFSALQKSAKDCIQSTENVVRIDMSGNSYRCSGPKRLPDIDIEVVCTALIHSAVFITSLNLQYCNFTDDAAMAVARLVQESFSLEELNIMCNDITALGAGFLADALLHTRTLKILKMNGNKIGDKGAMHLALALEKNKTLTSLDLGDCDLEIDSIIAFCSSLHTNTSLRAINLSRPILFSLQEEAVVHLENMLKENTTLRELHLEKFVIRDFGVERLCEGLMENKSLTYLNLSRNRISRDGAFLLSKLLRYNQTLEVLDLGYNRIESPGAVYLSDVLTGLNRGISTLGIIYNEIKGDGLVAIASAFELNWNFTNVYIWGNEIDDEASTAFGKLVRSKKLKLKNTDVKPYVVDGQTYLAELSHGIKPFYYWQPCYGMDYVGGSDEEDLCDQLWLL